VKSEKRIIIASSQKKEWNFSYRNKKAPAARD